MNIEEIEKLCNEALMPYRSSISDSFHTRQIAIEPEKLLRLIAVAKAANKYMKTIQERRPEFVSFERLLETLETLEEE